MVRTATKVSRHKAIQKQLAARSEQRTDILYEVEKIVNKKIVNGKTYYEVKWVGYDSSENTWQRRGSLKLCKFVIQNFERSLKKASGVKGQRQ